MEMTAFDLTPVRPQLLEEPQPHRSRRFTDPISTLNDDIHEETKRLVNAIERVDSLGIQILSVEAERSRNKRILVAYSRECDALDGVEVVRQDGYSHWSANRFGVEVRWAIPLEAA